MTTSTYRRNLAALAVIRNRIMHPYGRSETEMTELISMVVLVAMGNLGDYGRGELN